MKKRIALIVVVLTTLLLFGFGMIAKTGKAGYTGSPGESSCNYCHNSFALNSGSGSVKIVHNIPNNLYEPDSTYQVSIVVSKPGVSLFGFGCEALKSGNTNAGTFIVTNTVRTQQLTATNGR